MTVEPGLRERKKQRTRLALIDAALSLFLERGFSATTIDEIVAAVDVSQRTFFRYFGTKEDVITAFLTDFDDVFLAELDARPPGEPPFRSLMAALIVMLRQIGEGGRAQLERFRRIHQLIEAEPSLLGAQVTRHAEVERYLAAAVAERQGVPADDPRALLVVAFHSAATRAALHCSVVRDEWEPAALVAEVEQMADAARSVAREWF